MPEKIIVTTALNMAMREKIIQQTTSTTPLKLIMSKTIIQLLVTMYTTYYISVNVEHAIMPSNEFSNDLQTADMIILPGLNLV